MRLKVFLFSLIALLVVVGATGAVLYTTGALSPKVRTDVDLGEKHQDRTPKYRYVADLCERIDVATYEQVVSLKEPLKPYTQEKDSEVGSYVQCTAEFDVDAPASISTLFIGSSVRDTESTATDDVDNAPEVYAEYEWKDLPGQWEKGSIGYGNSRATGVTQVYLAIKDGKHFTEIALTIPGHVDAEPQLTAAAYDSAVQVLTLARTDNGRD